MNGTRDVPHTHFSTRPMLLWKRFVITNLKQTLSELVRSVINSWSDASRIFKLVNGLERDTGLGISSQTMAATPQCAIMEIIYSLYILPTLNASAAIATIPLVYMYIKQRSSNTTLFGLGLLFYAIIFLCFITAIAQHLCKCLDDYNFLTNYLDMANGTFYSLQSTLIVVIWCKRLQSIFDGTSLVPSRCTMNSFFAVITIVAVCGPAFAIWFNLLQEFSPDSPWLLPVDLFRALLTLIYLCVLIWLNCLFLRKMHAVFNWHDDPQMAKNEKISNIITKTSVLCAISSLSIILFIIPFFLNGSVVGSHHVMFAADVMFVVDLSTNFLSIWLSNVAFVAYYNRMCGCCDTLCRFCIGGVTKDMVILASQSTSLPELHVAGMHVPVTSTSIAVWIDTYSFFFFLTFVNFPIALLSLWYCNLWILCVLLTNPTFPTYMYSDMMRFTVLRSRWERDIGPCLCDGCIRFIC